LILAKQAGRRFALSDKNTERARVATLDLDYNQAVNHATKFIARFLLQVNARGLMIENAAAKFNKFLSLPEKNSTLGPYLELAWSLVSAAIPLLKVATMVHTGERLLDAAKLVENNVSRLQAAHDKVKKVKDAKDDYLDPALDIIEKGKATVSEVPDGLAELQKLDQSKGPIKELMADAQRMIRVWEGVLELLPIIKFNRVVAPSQGSSVTMLALARNILRLPEFDTPEALDQIERAFLYAMIGDWVRLNVTIETYSTNGNTKAVGLNSTQISTIMALFGPGVLRDAKYFTAPVYPNYWMYLRAWKAKAVRIEFQYDGGVVGNKF
jgi:hypothetical protein